jgi:hypothetical protein
MTRSTSNLVPSRAANPGGTYDPPVTVPTVGSQLSVDETSIRTLSEFWPASLESRTKDDLGPIPEHHQIPRDDLTAEIKSTATHVASALSANSSQHPISEIREWCDEHGFDLSDEDEIFTIVARQAVFNLLLKTSLYEWHHKHDDLPALTTEIRSDLQQAKEKTGDPAFNESVLDELAWLVDEDELQTVVDERHQLLESTQPTEDIGLLYAALIPNERRRPLGQYYTPSNIGKVMRTWAAGGDDVVLDPGMGPGSLSRPFHPQWMVDTDPAHIHGIDQCRLGYLMGTTALTLARQAHSPRRADFLDLSSDNLSKDVDAVVCNPPYTRHQSLSADYKETINAQAEQETGLDISTASPLYSYFLYHAREFLTAGDRAAFIIPHHFLATNYGETLKRFLLSEFDIKALLLFNPASDSEGVFTGALTTALVAFLEVPDESGTSGYTRFIRVDGWLDEVPVRNILRDSEQGLTDWGFINCVRQADLVPGANWQALFNPLDFDTSTLTPLSELAAVSRGIMTGENDFFILSQADIDEWGIESQYLARLVPGPGTVRGYDVRSGDWEDHQDSDEGVWLLYHGDAIDGVPQTIEAAASGCPTELTLTPDTTSSASLVEYLQAGLVEHPTLTERQTVRSRSPWYRVDRRDPAPILVPYMSRSGFRALLNETDARHVNNYHGIYPDGSLEQTQVKALLAYLNSSFADEVVRRHDRTYAGGMGKLEPGDLADVPVLDPRLLSDHVVATLARYFDELRDTARRKNSCEEVIDRIDVIVQEEL